MKTVLDKNINEQLIKLKEERKIIGNEYINILKEFGECIELNEIENKSINIITNYFNKLMVINEEINMLSEIQNKIENQEYCENDIEITNAMYNCRHEFKREVK